MTPAKVLKCRYESVPLALAPVSSCGAKWLRVSSLLMNTLNTVPVCPVDEFRAAAR